MCHFGTHRAESEYEFLEDADDELEEDVEFDDEYEEAEDVQIVADGGE